MKAVYLLLVIITAQDGSKEILEVSGIQHKDLLMCYAEQEQYRSNQFMQFFCKRN